MAKQQTCEGCDQREQNPCRKEANQIFDLTPKNSPVTASTNRTPPPYAIVAYQTAYLKANYPVEFLAASMTLDHGRYRQARGISRRGGAARYQGRAARRSIAPARSSTSRATRSSTRLRRCAALAGRPSKASSRRATSARSPASPTSPAASIRAPSISACWRALPPPARSTPSNRTARASLRRSTRSLPPRNALRTMRPVASPNCLGGRLRPSR